MRLIFFNFDFFCNFFFFLDEIIRDDGSEESCLRLSHASVVWKG